MKEVIIETTIKCTEVLKDVEEKIRCSFALLGSMDGLSYSGRRYATNRVRDNVLQLVRELREENERLRKELQNNG